MTRKRSAAGLVCALGVVAAYSFSMDVATAGRGNGPIIYVVSQGLYYDSIETADHLPQKGKFQMLNPNHPMGLATMVGPGDPAYLGGRWWVDMTGDGEMNEGDHFFSCPLLGPGSETP
jgi:hypothetical protein